MLENINFNEIISIIEKRKSNAYKKVNEELILANLEVGKFLHEVIEKSGYGDKVIERATDFMNTNYPGVKGYSKRNIERMVYFYKSYKDEPDLHQFLTKINWTNNLIILSRSKSKEERDFYLKLTTKENYSKAELNRQIDSQYYLRYEANQNALPSAIKAIDEDDYPNTKILDLYSLEFADLPNEYSEKDLKKSIMNNLKMFILEIGKSFSFVGEEYRVQVGTHDYFIDLLFFNREYSCLVAFELKVGEFKAEYISKMGLYLEALDRDVKKKNENPSVGIILCTDKDDTVVEYALSKNLSQTLVSEYKLKLIDSKLLENKIKEMKEILQTNLEDNI